MFAEAVCDFLEGREGNYRELRKRIGSEQLSSLESISNEVYSLNGRPKTRDFLHTLIFSGLLRNKNIQTYLELRHLLIGGRWREDYEEYLRANSGRENE